MGALIAAEGVHTFREGLLWVGGFTSTTALLSSSDEPGEGNESLDSFVSICIASLFSWELRGSTASLLGTGVRVVGRFAGTAELDFVVDSFKVEEGNALALLEGAGVEEAVLDGVADLEKKPKMLCCFPVDAVLALFVCFFAGVWAGALDFSPIVAERLSGTS